MKRFLSILALVLFVQQVFSQSTPGLWPGPVISGQDTLIIYPPQFETWSGNTLTGRAAVQYLRKGQDETFGIISFSTQTETDIANSAIYTSNFVVGECNFPALGDRGQSLSTVLTQQLSVQNNIPLEQVKLSLASNQNNTITTTEVNNDPPHVYYSSTPAVLVIVDGEPHTQKTNSAQWQRVINTSVFMVWSQDKKVYEMNLFGKWFQSPQLDNSWAIDAEPDAALNGLLSTALSADSSIQTFNPPSDEIGNLLEYGVAPKIFTSTKPAELLITDGSPNYQPITNTNLLYVTNTNADLFKYVNDGNDYVLLSGRWFKSADVNSAWTYVSPDQLPDDFKNIPEEHIKSNALVSVPGTTPAQEAVISSQIPQTATVNRQTATTQVTYDGNPQFQPINSSGMQYAVNTSTPVIMYDNSYYAVTNGVWYNSVSPVGPWIVATFVPQVIYTIPPSNPLYYVTFVRVYGYTPNVVYMGYTPGYYGCYVNTWGTVVYGTGWNYRPWVGNYWYGNPYSYGVGFHSGWSSWGGWYMGYGYGRSYYPVCRPWWGPTAYGPHRPVYVNYNHVNIYHYNRGNYVVSNTNHNPRGNNPGSYYHNNNVGNRNNYYAGKNGAVYRQNGAGQWHQYGANGWNAVPNNGNNNNQQGNINPRTGGGNNNMQGGQGNNGGNGNHAQNNPRPASPGGNYNQAPHQNNYNNNQNVGGQHYYQQQQQARQQSQFRIQGQQNYQHYNNGGNMNTGGYGGSYNHPYNGGGNAGGGGSMRGGGGNFGGGGGGRPSGGGGGRR